MKATDEKIELLTREIDALKEQVSRLVPLDDEGAYKASFLKKIEKARASKTRYTFKAGRFTRA